MSGTPHVYLGSDDGLDPCAFAYSGSQGGNCGYFRNNGIHLAMTEMPLLSLADVGDVPTERLILGGAEFEIPRARAGSREAGNEFVDGGGPSIAEEAAWRVAANALLTDDGRVPSGPWPVRKYVLADESSAVCMHERTLYQSLLDALYTTGLDYMVAVYRPSVGCAWRCVVVTWGWATTLTLEAIADELALIYDRHPE